MRTLVDEDALETARQASLRSSAPPKEPASSSPPPEKLPVRWLARVPVLSVARSELASLSIDPAGGFLIGFVDGAATLEAIVDRSGFSAADVLTAFATLQKQGVVVFREI
jgi:hypothetical protein